MIGVWPGIAKVGVVCAEGDPPARGAAPSEVLRTEEVEKWEAEAVAYKDCEGEIV